MKPRNLVLLIVALLALPGRAPAAPQRITLDEAVALAVRGNALVKLARLRIAENEKRAHGMRANYFPRLTNSSYYFKLTDGQFVNIPAGSLGTLPGLGPVPPGDATLSQGSTSYVVSGTRLAQPLTQLIKVRHGYRIAQLDAAIAGEKARAAEDEIALKVHEVYFALLALERQRRAAAIRVSAAKQTLADAETAVEAGEKLPVAAIGAKAAWLESRHHRLETTNQESDLRIEFNDLLGLPLETEVELVEPPPVADERVDKASMLETAMARSTEIRAARQTVEKARRAVAAAKTEYIPEVSAFAEHLYQNGVPFVVRNNGTFGVRMDWDIFSFGRRKSVVDERRVQLEEAEQELRRVERRVTIEIEKSVRKLELAREMLGVAGEAAALRREAQRIAGDEKASGVIPESKRIEAEAATAEAEADLLRAQLGFRMARAELERVAGLRPGGPEKPAQPPAESVLPAPH